MFWIFGVCVCLEYLSIVPPENTYALCWIFGICVCLEYLSIVPPANTYAMCWVFNVCVCLEYLSIVPPNMAKLAKYLDIWLFGYLAARRNHDQVGYP